MQADTVRLEDGNTRATLAGALAKPLFSSPRPGRGMDMREVEVLRDRLVDTSDLAASLVQTTGGQPRK